MTILVCAVLGLAAYAVLNLNIENEFLKPVLAYGILALMVYTLIYLNVLKDSLWVLGVYAILAFVVYIFMYLHALIGNYVILVIVVLGVSVYKYLNKGEVEFHLPDNRDSP